MDSPNQPTAKHFAINHNYASYVVTGSTLLLFVGFFLLNFFHLFNLNSASATSTSSLTTLTLEPSLSAPIVDPSSVILTLTPEADSSFVHGAASVDVSTNNSTGYTLSISTVSNDNNLNFGGVTGASSNIGALSNETTLATFSSPSDTTTLNKWGFTTDNNGSDPSSGEIILDHYLAVPNNTNSRVIKVTDTPANTSITNVTLATKVNRDLPAGPYSNTIIFTATANTNPNTFMQDFTIAKCNQLDPWSYDSTTGTVHEGDTVTLWDKRDNNSYKVRKLADGNCWMVENLKLENYILSHNDSDVPEGYTFQIPAANNNLWIDTTEDRTIAMLANSNTEGYTDYGMYYSWAAAIASNTDYLGVQNVNTSICPKNWDLPTSGSLNSNSEWNQLFHAINAIYDFENLSGGGNILTNKINLTNDINKDPLIFNFQYSGGWTPWSTINPQNQGTLGCWWSSTSSSRYNDDVAYSPSINYSNNSVIVDGFSTKRVGFSVRCLLNTGGNQ